MSTGPGEFTPLLQTLTLRQVSEADIEAFGVFLRDVRCNTQRQSTRRRLFAAQPCAKGGNAVGLHSVPLDIGPPRRLGGIGLCPIIEGLSPWG